MDRLSVMKAFCRIVERGSFARAAEDLGVSAPLLSRELKRLEQSLGCTLLSRSTRRMALTDHGRLYYADAARILADVAQAEDRLRAGAGVVRGRLRVNAPHSFGTAVLAPMLPGLMARHPDLELDLSLDDRVVDMIEGAFDLSIRIRTALPDSQLIARRIAPVRQALFAAPDYLARHGTPQDPGDLHAHRAVGYLLADQGGGWPLTGPDGTRTIAPAPRLNVGGSLLLRDMLIAGEGIGALPDCASAPAERSGALTRVLPDHALPGRHIFALTPSRLGADAKVQAFVDAMTAAIHAPA
jgi:DNA-binding transcriptional LysR family regulator